MNDCTINSQMFDISDHEQSANSQQDERQNEQKTSPLPILVEIEEENIECQQRVPLWSIDDDLLFHPLGLINHGTGTGKSVFVTWSQDYLLNFVFKKSSKTNAVKLTKVRVDTAGEVIVHILILDLNTLLLMQSGRVYYFSSVKSLRPVPWLSGVRCISAAQLGFSIIRRLPDNALSLEIYRDMVNLGKSECTLVHSFDITYDEQNLFNCEWRDERFTLVSQSVDEEHVNFLNEMIGEECALSIGQEVHIFTVTGHVFALVADTASADTTTNAPDFHIEMLCIYASPVEFMKILCPLQMCIVFLQCGTIDIWYRSQIMDRFQRLAHHTGTRYTHYEFCTGNCCFYFTDEEKVGQLHFKYDAKTDKCSVHETYKAVPGMLACTWVESLQQLICVSCNNIFYQLTFESEVPVAEVAANATEFDKLNELYELTPTQLARMSEKARVVDELARVPARLHEAIEAEFLKRQLIAVAHKTHIYKKVFAAHLEYSTQMPGPFDNETALFYTNTICLMHSQSLLALIYLKLSKNRIFNCAGIQWNLYINYNGTTHLLCIPNHLLHTNLCIVIPLQRSEHDLLPAFQLKLVTFVANGADAVAISLPIPLQITAKTYASLFSPTTMSLSMCTEYSLKDLIASFNKQTRASQLTTATYTLSLPKEFNFNTVLCIFKATKRTLEGDEAFELYFMSYKLKFTYIKERKCLQLECPEPVALYYAKLHLFNNLNQLFKQGLESTLDSNTALQQLLQYQCDVERGYGGALLEFDRDISLGSPEMHIEHLKSVYTKLRTQFCHIIR